MKKKRVLLILNLNAGTGRIKADLTDLLNLLTRSEFETVVHVTQCALDAQKISEEYAANGIDRIICAGGDGTLDEVARGVMASGMKTPIGYIPCGTTNDLGYTLGLSDSPIEAALIAIGGKPFDCDIACFNKVYFTYTAAFGLFTEVSYATPQNVKNIFGRLAYILNGAKQLPKTKSYNLTIRFTDGEVEKKVSGGFIYGMVANSNSVGGFRGLLGDDVKLDDGLFELILVKTPKNIADLTVIINQLMQHQYDKQHIICVKTDYVKVTSEEPIPWTLDGEFGGKTDNAVIEVKKKSITYICNKNNQIQQDGMEKKSTDNQDMPGNGEVNV